VNYVNTVFFNKNSLGVVRGAAEQSRINSISFMVRTKTLTGLLLPFFMEMPASGTHIQYTIHCEYNKG